MTDLRTGTTRYRVMIVDDNAMVRAGLAALLEVRDDMDVVGEAGDGKLALELAARLVPDVVLLDVRMPRVNGVAAVQRLSEHSRVIMLTRVDEADTVLTAIRRGASGYLVHGSFTADELVGAIHDTVHRRAHPLSSAAVTALVDAARTDPAASSAPDTAAAREKFGLSAREAEVMDLIVQGYSNAQVASTLFLSEKTVKNHINRIYAKLGAEGRAKAILTWLGKPVGELGP